MADKKSEAIALFRYRIIAHVLNNTGKGQMKHFREMAKKEHDVPYVGKAYYKAATFKGWLRDYRNGGFDALKPKERIDKGCSRKIDEQLGKIIKEKVEHYPFVSSAAVYRLLISEGDISPHQLGEGTLRKYIKDNELKIFTEPTPRKKYEKQTINQLWIADCMHGPYIMDQKRKLWI